MALVPLVHDCNHANSVDLGAFAKAGGQGVIHKATQGNYVDPEYKARRVLAEAAGLAWGAYDFNTGDSVASQVARFLQTAQPDFDTSMWLDFEDNRVSQMSLGEAQEFLDRVDQAIGRPCGMYSGNRAKELLADAKQSQVEFFALHPLWLCQYKIVKADVDLDQLNKLIALPIAWKEYFLLQYTGDGIGPMPHTMPGLEKGADLSVFNGSAAELRARWNLGPAKAVSQPQIAASGALPALQPVAATAASAAEYCSEYGGECGAPCGIVGAKCCERACKAVSSHASRRRSRLYCSRLLIRHSRRITTSQTITSAINSTTVTAPPPTSSAGAALRAVLGLLRLTHRRTRRGPGLRSNPAVRTTREWCHRRASGRILAACELHSYAQRSALLFARSCLFA